MGKLEYLIFFTEVWIKKYWKQKWIHIIYTIYCYILNQQCLIPRLSYAFLKLFMCLLFIFGSAGSLLMSRLLSGWGKQGILSSCGAQTYCRGFSYCRAQVLGHVDSVAVISQSLGHSLNSCGYNRLNTF